MAVKKKLPPGHPMSTAKPPKVPAVQLAPPPGTYDPSLDANSAAANRGLFDLGQDINTQNQRDTVDYGLGVADINRGAGRSLEDIAAQRAGLTTSRDRGLADVGTQRGYATEDHATALAGLQRQYGQLGNSQQQQMNAAGVLRGGAALQAARKRSANQALDQQPIDTSFGRQIAGFDTAQQRIGEDFTTQSGQLDTQATRVGEDQTRGLGQLALQMAPPDAGNPLGGRNFQDRGTQLTRAARENTAFGIDTAAAKAYGAAASGWNPILPKKRKKAVA